MTTPEIVGSLIELSRILAWPILIVVLVLVFKEQIRRGAERLIEFSLTGGAKVRTSDNAGPDCTT
jgi:hypothetical protein